MPSKGSVFEVPLGVTSPSFLKISTRDKKKKIVFLVCFEATELIYVLQ